MHKKIIYTTAFAFSLSLAGFGVSFAHHGPADMTLKTEQAKKPAAFPHHKHQDMMECGECHHSKGPGGEKVPYEEGMEIKSCPTCHNEQMENKKLNSYMKAAHENCRGCHKEAAKEGKNAPTKCSGCHPK